MFLLDAHTHLHPEYCLRRYLEGARTSLSQHVSLRDHSTWQCCLCMAETPTSDVYNRLERARATESFSNLGRWRLLPTEEPASYIAKHEEKGRIILILGRQLRTNDGFEVLQIGSLARMSNSPSDLRTQVYRVLERGGYPVVPWGFGKWTFRRKRILLDCLRAWDPQDVALADSALRPRVLSDHPVLSAARERGFTILAGTDPLPLPSHERRSGRFVSALDAELNLNRPWSDLRTQLSGAQPAVLGERDSLVRSLWDQARLRMG